MFIFTLLFQPVLTVCAEEPDESQLDAVPVAALVSAQEESIDSADEAEAADGAEEAASVSEVTEVTAEVPAANEDISGRDFGLTAKGAVLMEASSKTVIYESNADTQMSPASITKIMTLILIFDAINAGKITLKDEVVTSARAKSMGGSQVFLEEGEKQTVETLIKCIVISSGNDASVAMAEYIGGTEEEFVNMMNERAKELGMNNTHFVDCCGLTEDPAHLTTAWDVALMAQELIVKYPQIKDYSTIWMDTITHVTNKGSSEFGLSNTNKLLKMATNFTVTGLKTGSTSKAKYCVAATAYKDGIEMIAVILGAADYKVRFSEAEKLLNFGYSKCRLYKDSDEQREPLEKIKVDNGKQDYASLEYNGDFSFVDINGGDLSKIEKRIELEDKVKAPIEAGQVLGYLIYELDGKVIGKVEIIAADSVEEADFIDCLRKILDLWKL
ncbi:MAG: D-alanyl-D-alanine carboxypeptidase [Lachnospiraceae bacterium]|nr:D-alanyl-D-alanine carboxypeptidase [Lachnospiraceae bacterium]